VDGYRGRILCIEHWILHLYDNGNAELFADHFESVFESYNDEVFCDFKDSTMTTINFTQKKVKKCLEGLDDKKSMSLDEIDPKCVSVLPSKNLPNTRGICLSVSIIADSD
jgi:hypothetical protein